MSLALLRSTLAIFLLSPFLILIWKSNLELNLTEPWFWRLMDSFRVTVFQAGLSTMFSILLGFGAAIGLLRAERWRKILTWLCLVPAFFPTAFVLLAAFEMWSPLGFPFGIWGIVFVHCLIYSGLATFGFVRIFEERIGGWAELAWVEGASSFSFLAAAFPNLMRPGLLLALSIFVACFASFSVPLMAGGPGAPVLEVLVYESFRTGGGLASPLLIALFQGVYVLALGWSISSAPAERRSRVVHWGLFNFPYILWAVAALSLFVLLSPLLELPIGLPQVLLLFPGSSLLKVVAGSLVVSTLVGVFSFALFTLALASLPHRSFERFLAGAFAPSSVLVGLAFLILGWGQSLIGITLALTLIFWGGLFRMRLLDGFSELRTQIDISQTLGATPWMTFWNIVFPQMSRDIGFCSGLAAFWSVGEFAVSGILSGQRSTLGLVLGGLLGSYRLEAAGVITLVVLFLGSSLFWFFWRLGYVLSRRFN